MFIIEKLGKDWALVKEIPKQQEYHTNNEAKGYKMVKIGL